MEGVQTGAVSGLKEVAKGGREWVVRRRRTIVIRVACDGDPVSDRNAIAGAGLGGQQEADNSHSGGLRLGPYE